MVIAGLERYRQSRFEVVAVILYQKNSWTFHCVYAGQLDLSYYIYIYSLILCVYIQLLQLHNYI